MSRENIYENQGSGSAPTGRTEHIHAQAEYPREEFEAIKETVAQSSIDRNRAVEVDIVKESFGTRANLYQDGEQVHSLISQSEHNAVFSARNYALSNNLQVTKINNRPKNC